MLSSSPASRFTSSAVEAPSFFPEIAAFPREEAFRLVREATEADVRRALAAEAPLEARDVAALISPAARPHLEALAQRAHAVSVQRHGRVVVLYVPLYLSNFCVNHCIYCGFKAGIKRIRRETLTRDQIEREAARLRDMGFRHLLLVSGEDHDEMPLEYMVDAVRICRRSFDSVAIEFESLPAHAYEALVEAGCDGMTLYQETYDRDVYKWAHPGKGPKSNFANRIDAPDRAARAGMRTLGLGALLGLGDWRFEVLALYMHARYLMRHFWQTRLSLGFPRLRNETGGFQTKRPVSDRQFVQLFLALRMALPDAEFVLSTRESPFMRRHLLPLGVNRVSAGSKTTPGGYANETDAGAQFEIVDERPPREVAEMIAELGYEPVWKDWDHGFHDDMSGLAHQ